MYQMRRLCVPDGREMLIHMASAAGEDVLEIYMAGCSVMLTKEQFTLMVEWVNAQFEILSKQPPAIVH
jgi:hypothetical protein